MLVTLQRLRIVLSFSRSSVSIGNSYSESLFGTMKYTPTYPSRPFTSLEAARAWVHSFVHRYNHIHYHGALQFVPPAERHSGRDPDILAQRSAVYEATKQQHPERWSGTTRNCLPVGDVWLNPDRSAELGSEMKEQTA